MKFKISDTVLFVIFIALLVYILCVQRMKRIKGGDRRNTGELAKILNELREILYNIPKLPEIMNKNLPPQLKLPVGRMNDDGPPIQFTKELLDTAAAGNVESRRQVEELFLHMKDELLLPDSTIIQQLDEYISRIARNPSTYIPPTPPIGSAAPPPGQQLPPRPPAVLPPPMIPVEAQTLPRIRQIAPPMSPEFNAPFINLEEIRATQQAAEKNIDQYRNSNPDIVIKYARKLVEIDAYIDWTQSLRTLEHYWAVVKEYGNFLRMFNGPVLKDLKDDIINNRRLNVRHFRGILDRFSTLYRGMGIGPPGDGGLIPKIQELEDLLKVREAEVNKLKVDLNLKDDELRARQQEIDKLRKDLASRNIELAELKDRLRESQDIVAARNRELITKNTEIQELEKRSNTKEELEGRLDIERKAAERLKIQIDALNKSIEDSAKEVRELKQRIADIEQRLAESQDEVDLLKRENGRLEEALRRAATDVDELNRIIAELRETIEQRDAEIKGLREEIDRLMKELENSRRENEDLRRRLEEGDRRLLDELAGKDVRIEALQKELEDCFRKLAEKDADIAQLREDIKLLREEIDRLRAAAAAPAAAAPAAAPAAAIGADEILQLVTTLRQQPRDITVNVNTPAPIYVEDEPLKINDKVTRHLKKPYR